MTRRFPLLVLTLALAIGAFAQEKTATKPATTDTTATATAATDTTDTIVESRSSDVIRNQFISVLSDHPPELATILKLDPTLLSNEAFLSGYPELAKFVKGSPEVTRNPRFYLSSVKVPGESGNTLDQIVEFIAIGALWVVLTFGFAWLVRTWIDQRRWTRLSRVQTEVHNKILDRFGTSEEVLAYIKSPAGTKFLESAPISVRSEEPARNTPLSRVMLSIQLGVVVAAGALGILLVSFRFTGETAQGLFAIGVITFFIGAGFIASALVSIFMSRRLGMTPPIETSEPVP